MSEKYEFHYINPNYRMKTTKKSEQEIENLPKHHTNDEYEFAFRGDCKILEGYNYVPYYDKKNKK